MIQCDDNLYKKTMVGHSAEERELRQRIKPVLFVAFWYIVVFRWAAVQIKSQNKSHFYLRLSCHQTPPIKMYNTCLQMLFFISFFLLLKISFFFLFCRHHIRRCSYSCSFWAIECGGIWWKCGTIWMRVSRRRNGIVFSPGCMYAGLADMTQHDTHQHNDQVLICTVL